MKETLETDFIHLIHQNSFAARLFAGVNREEDSTIPTIGIQVDPETFLGIKLVYNLTFIEKIGNDLEVLNFVLNHEAYHLMSRQIERFMCSDYPEKLTKDGANVAMDMAANTLLIQSHWSLYNNPVRKKLEELGGIFPEAPPFNYPTLASTETYFELLSQDTRFPAVSMTDLLEGKYTSSHRWPSEASSDGRAASLKDQSALNKIKYNLAAHIKETAEAHKSRGTLPGYARDFLGSFQSLNYSPPWTEYLKSHVASGQASFRERSMVRLNRRVLGIPELSPYPGRKLCRGYKVAFMMDTSGSMGIPEMRAGAATLLSLQQRNPALEIWAAEADTEIHKLYQMRDPSSIQRTVSGRGGTNFIFPLQEIEERIRPDIAVYFTDGDGPAPSRPPRFPIIWCLTKGGIVPANYGAVLRIS